MTEEEKQYRAETCTPEDFNNLVDSLLEQVVSLYSIATRVSVGRLANFVAFEGEDQHVWAKVRTAETYMNAFNLKVQDCR